MASFLRNLGLSFADVGFVKLNVFFGPMVLLAHGIVTTWCKSEMSLAAVNQMPVPAEKVPFFVLILMPIIAILCAIIALEALSALASTGYQSQKGREQKDAGNLAKAGLPGWISRTQAAQYNTFECCILMLCTFFVAKELAVPKLLFAKIATLLLLLRVTYPVLYATDLDMFRTQVWLTGTYPCVLLGFAALFPDTVLPMLGEVVVVPKKGW